MRTVEDHLLLELDRSAGESMRAQLERGLRTAIRDGRLHPGTRLPSSRALAERLHLSRGVVVEAYAQLVAEGYLHARQGSSTRVAPGARGPAPAAVAPARQRPPRYDFGLGVPDLAAFPRAAWVAALRRALHDTPDARLGHPDPRGAGPLRRALAAYLGRVRGVVATPERVLVCTGFAQGLGLVARALRAQGVRRVAMEDPGFVLHRWIVGGAGLDVVPVPVDDSGLRIDALAASGAEAVLLAPALRLGWLVLPERLADRVTFEKLLADAGSPTLEQLALADLITRGEHDRHLRRMRLVYRRRRDALVTAVADHLPGACVGGVAAGLHAIVSLPAGVEEAAVVAAARERDVAVEPASTHRFVPGGAPAALLAGYAQLPEPAIREGVRRIGDAVRAVSAPQRAQ